MNKVKKAYKIAKRYHAGQVDKAGKPYIGHPIAVASKLKTDDEKILGYLHDVLEDTNCDEGYLRKLFGDSLVDVLLILTHGKDESYQDYLSRVKTNQLAMRVKLADLSHNMELTRLDAIDDKAKKRVVKYLNAWRYLLDIS